MARSFKLPDLGEGIHEGEVLAVLVSVGDDVKEGDTLMEVETDKAAVEVPSPYTATVKEILVKPGDVVQVGDVLVTFSNGEEAGEEEAPEEKAAPKKEAEKEEKKEKPESEKEEAVQKVKAEEKPPEPPKEKAEEKPEEKAVEGRKPVPREEGPVPASPSTRRLARELGVDLHEVTPSGPQGLVTAEDVRALAEKGEEARPEKEKPPAKEEKPAEARPITVPSAELPDFTKWGPVEKIPVKSIRRATAKQMALAWSQIPHVNSYDDVDLTELEAFRQKHKAEVEERGGKLTLTVFALKAAVGALKAHPNFNASLDTEKGEIILKRYYHVGVAAATDDGLIVPVVRDVDRKSIVELSIELKDLVERTRQRKVKLEEMQGGTFTITNVGPMGGGQFAPIINFPQVAILGMGSARMQPAVIEKGEKRYEIVPRLIMPIVLCIDHRVLDGADAMRFIKTVKDALEDPEQLLMRM
jgi:pyruvate dehydrogenase E2 component (dihydrolipoamide acetyltransferase)